MFARVVFVVRIFVTCLVDCALIVRVLHHALPAQRAYGISVLHAQVSTELAELFAEPDCSLPNETNQFYASAVRVTVVNSHTPLCSRLTTGAKRVGLEDARLNVVPASRMQRQAPDPPDQPILAVLAVRWSRTQDRPHLSSLGL